MPKISEDVSRAIGNLVWLGCERVTQIVVAIVISGVLARHIGPDVFGKWQYANTLLLVLVPITWVCGAEILVPTIVHEPPERLGTILGSAFALRFGISLAAMLVTWLVLGIGAHTGQIDAVVAAMLAGLAMTMLFREPFGVIGTWLQSRTHSKPALIAAIVAALAKMGLVVLFVRLAFAPAHLGWLWALESAAIAAALVAYYARQHGGRLGWHLDTRLFRHFVSAGSVFWLGLICMYLFLKLDRLMLERVVSYADLGRYSAAQQLNENWITLALMLAQTLGPAFVYRVHDTARLLRNMVRLLAMTAALMIVGALTLDALGGLIIRTVFGPGFDGAADIFRWAVWLSLPAGVEAIANLVVLKYQARYVLLTKWLCALAAAFATNLVTISRFGGHGALMGLAAGYVVAIAVDLYYIRFRLAPT
ncbi:lipopolysaccharide biosynthesis protein [Pararobbsia silviterrae]|uniref:lipopolysaccharide biosynthesis protein n=1 Tax=Pararobbsia silviterrae TaxID=1792498 RepID=UPI001F0B8389|nr:oligosaccharide flippase family protein [Pararobbsia silviterrae]